MKTGALCSTILTLLCSLALPALGQQYFLYEPKPATAGAQEPAKDGILVKEIPIKEGDTLYAISRRLSGYGMYYPQILLFNDIKNPNLIYSGSTLRVPLPHGEVAGQDAAPKGPEAKQPAHSAKKGKKHLAAVEPSRKPGKAASSAGKSAGLKVKISDETAKPADKAIGETVDSSLPDLKPDKPVKQAKDPSAAPAAGNSGAQQLFEKAVKAYRQDDCKTALELFDRYLSENAALPLAAEASLYKAECYLKLSSQ